VSIDLVLSQSFPAKNAASQLRGEVLRYLKRARPQPGTPLATEARLVELSRLSRSTVRRALDPLERDGWIDRRVGAGTFVGARVREALPDDGPAPPAVRGPAKTVRIAVLIFSIGDLAHDWYTPRILEGIDEVAHEHPVSVELVGDRDGDSDAISRRLENSRPDVLVCLSSEPRHSFVIRDAQKMGIRCVVAGTPHLGLGIHGVCEDNRQATRLAVQHLVEQGHRRIGFAIQRVVEPWVMERHEAYHEALASAGIEPDESLVHWIGRNEPRGGSAKSQEAMHKFLQTRRPTGLLAGSHLPMLYIEQFCRNGRLAVPDDLSVVSFEQDSVTGQGLAPAGTTYVRFPLCEMGRTIANMARGLVAGETQQQTVLLSAELVPGGTVRRLEGV
jgi:LacI family transcriptional regulator